MRYTVNTTEAQSFELAEPGPYDMIVESMDAPVKGPKSTYTNVAFKFEDPQMDKQCGKVFRKYPMDGKGAGFFREFWKAATGQDIPIGVVIDVDFDDAIGRRVRVDIIHEESPGYPTKNAPGKIVSNE